MRTNHVKIVLNFETSVLRKTRRKKNAFFTWQLWFKFLTLPRKGSKFLSFPGTEDSQMPVRYSAGERGDVEASKWVEFFHVTRKEQMLFKYD